MNEVDECVARYCEHGDTEAFARVVAEYRPMVAGICRKYVIEPGDVEDAVQETFVKLARRVGQIEGDAGAWLATVAGTTALDYARRSLRERARRKRLAVEYKEEWRDVPSGRALEARLHEALEGLDPVMRSLVMSRFFMGEAVREMAKRSGVGSTTMSRRVAKAVGKVRHALEAMGYWNMEDALRGEDWEGKELGRQVGPARLATGKIRVGILLSHETAELKLTEMTPNFVNPEFRAEASFQLRPTKLARGEKYQLISMLEPGTDELSPIEKGLRDHDITQGSVDVTDAEALKTLDVIVLGRAYAVTRRLLEAVESAVESGVGLYTEGQLGTGFPGIRDPRVCRLMLADRVSMYHTLGEHNAPRPATVIAEHPILAGVPVGAQVMVGGCGPVFVPTAPESKVMMHKDEPVNPQDPPMEALNGLRPPAIVTGKLGKGRVVVVGMQFPWPLQELPGLRGNFVHNAWDWLAEERVKEKGFWGMTNDK